MASWIANSQVQQWLEATRMPAVAVDATLEVTAQALIRGALHNRYDVTTWVNAATTPLLIQSLDSMYNAGMQYQRQFAEDIAGYAGQMNWGQYLIKMFNDLLTQLADGEIELDDSVAVISPNGKPLFYPNDTTGLTDSNFDTKFSMGTTF